MRQQKHVKNISSSCLRFRVETRQLGFCKLRTKEAFNKNNNNNNKNNNNNDNNNGNNNINNIINNINNNNNNNNNNINNNDIVNKNQVI